jgi:beta-N-acetylhexosaminidase
LRLFPLVQAVLVLLAHQPAQAPGLPDLTPRQKAALLVVSGVPAPRGATAVIVRPGDPVGALPRHLLVFADQEGGLVKAFPELPPWSAASDYGSVAEAFAAGRATGRALHRAGVDVDLAPVLDAPSGPLGSRHFRTAALGIAFARGLRAGGVAACAKHFPGLGSARLSTDESPHVHGRLVRAEVRVFAAAIRDRVPCVMTSHALYGAFGGTRASTGSAAYRLLRRLGFDGVAITDSLDFAGSAHALPLARLAIRHGADLLLFTNGEDASRAVEMLVPLARRGLLDDRVARVLRLRHAAGIRSP